MTRDRNDTSSSTNANTHGARWPISALKSAVPAVSPVTATRTPGTRPSVSGMTVSRSVARARIDAASSPVPASGTWTSAAVRAGLTMNVIGWPPASAARVKACPASTTAGAVTSGASTTTTAGLPPPGKTCLIRL